MASKIKGTIAILTGGGDVPGLNPAIRAITIRAMREGYRVIGLRRGWAGIVELSQEKNVYKGKVIYSLLAVVILLICILLAVYIYFNKK